MKTPDEIKEGLEHCSDDGCKNCPYEQDCNMADGFSVLADDALAYIQQLETQVPKWISVEERLPEGCVLAANFAPGTYGYKEYIIGYVYAARCSEPGGCYAENDHEILHDVTHWMHLPKLPKDGAAP